MVSVITRLCAIGFILGFSACRQPVAYSDPAFDALRNVLATYPPRFSTTQEKEDAETELRRRVDDLTVAVEKETAGAHTHWQLGESYRLGRNLDWPETTPLAEHHLRAAAAMDPDNPLPRVSLGDLYIQQGPEFAPKAEREYRQALALAHGKSQAADRGLFFALYYQGLFSEAVASADRYLAAVPSDEDVKSLRAMAETNAK